MAYTVIKEGRKEVRWLVGPRPFSELLTHEELIQVECGELVGVNSRGGVLDLSSPLENGAEVTLSHHDLGRDLAIFGVPANDRGELVGIPEILRIRQYESEHNVNLWDRTIAEIRGLLASSEMSSIR